MARRDLQRFLWILHGVAGEKDLEVVGEYIGGLGSKAVDRLLGAIPHQHLIPNVQFIHASRMWSTLDLDSTVA